MYPGTLDGIRRGVTVRPIPGSMTEIDVAAVRRSK
jgi:hypothetical protein